MADKSEIYERLPLEHLSRLMNNQAGVEQASRPSGDFFKSGRMMRKLAGAQLNGSQGVQSKPLDQMIKGV